MRFRNTFILAGISLILLAYVVGVEFIWKEKKEKSESEQKKVFHFNDEGVKRITIKSKEEIVLEKVGVDTWMIVKPLRYEADSTTVKSVITSIKNLEIKKEIPVEDERPAIYGFDNPQGSIKVDTELNSFSFNVGKKSPVSYQLYIMREGEKEVILTGAGLDNHLRKSVDDFRDRKVIKIERDDIKSISFNTRGGSTLVEKMEEGWWIVSPYKVKASDEEINRILNSIDGLRVDQFVDDTPGNLKKYGLMPPEFTMSFLLKEKGLLELKIGTMDKGEKGRYAIVNTKPNVYLVRKSILEDINKRVDDLREKHIASFDPGKVSKFEILKGEERLIFEKDEEQNWKINGEPAKKYEIDSLIRKIREAKAKSFLKATKKNFGKAGLDNPMFVAKIHVNNEEEIEIRYGIVKDNDFFGYNPSQSEWIFIFNKDLYEQLNKTRADFISAP